MASSKATEAAREWLADHWIEDDAWHTHGDVLADLLDRFAADAAREEREACAMVAEYGRYCHSSAMQRGMVKRIAQDIRARSDGEEGR